MKFLGLPGRKQSTFDQMVELTRAVRLGQTETVVQSYGFWGGDDVPNPDIGPEAAIAGASQANVVIAKSIGTLVTMLAESRHGLAPAWCVFIGTPLRHLQATGLTDLLLDHCARTPTLFIQQSADPTGTYGELAGLVGTGERRPVCVEIPGDDHLYADVPGLAVIIEAWSSTLPPVSGVSPRS